MSSPKDQKQDDICGGAPSPEPCAPSVSHTGVRRNGSELDAGRDRVMAYFEARVVRGKGCWGWNGHIDKSGYGWASVGRVYHSTAHRLSYELTKGPIPEGFHVDHLCRNPSCVNPAHLEAVTPQENVRRGIGITATNTRKTHCPQGHPYTGDNLVLKKSGFRECRVCRRDGDRARRRRKGCAVGRLRSPVGFPP